LFSKSSVPRGSDYLLRSLPGTSPFYYNAFQACELLEFTPFSKIKVFIKHTDFE